MKLTKEKFLFPIAASVSTLSVLALTTLYVPAVSLGTIELTGGTKKISVDTNAINAGGTGGQLTGTIVNKTGSTVDDVTVSLNKSGSSGTPPTGGDSSVTDPGGTSSGNGSSTSTGTTANVTLGGGGGKASTMAPNGTATLNVNVATTGSGATIDVLVTPSVKDKQPDKAMHADVLAGFDLGGSSPGRTNSLLDSYHDRAYALVTNVDRNSESIYALSGEVNLGSGGATSLVSVHLCDLGANIEVPGASVSVTGDTFEITGFTELKPASSYYVTCVLTGVPSGSYSIELNALFH